MVCEILAGGSGKNGKDGRKACVGKAVSMTLMRIPQCLTVEVTLAELATYKQGS